MREPRSGPSERQVVAAGVALTAVLLGLTACSSSSDASSDAAAPTTSQTPTVTSSPSAHVRQYRAVRVDGKTKRASQATARSYVAATTRLLASPNDPAGAHPSVTGPALAALLATRTQYAKQHYRVVGRPRIVSQKVIKRHGDRLVVAACLDNSAVKVLDKDGDRVPSSAQERVMNLLTLVRRDGDWVVTRSVLPANAAC